MKYLIILLFLLNFINVTNASPRGATFKTPIQKLTCLPANAATSGIATSLDFGRTTTGCLGFTCNSGYTVSGSTCIVAFYNVVCTDPGNNSVLPRGVCTSSDNYNASTFYKYSNTGTIYYPFAYKFNCNTTVTSKSKATAVGVETSSIAAYVKDNGAEYLYSHELIYYGYCSTVP